MKFLENLIELVYWIAIFLCPTLICGVIGFVVYFNFNKPIGLIGFIVLSVLGVSLGVYFAERIRRTVGCSSFLTRKTPWSGDNRNDKN